VRTRRQLERFERLFLPHMPAAYTLARWLLDNPHDADDVVQEAFLRAFRAFGQFSGGNDRGWLLSIVRNTAYTWMRDHRLDRNVVAFDEVVHGLVTAGSGVALTAQEAALQSRAHRSLVHDALAELPVAFREVLVLRELEELSYREIASVIDAPIGTVMSRLARARLQLREILTTRRRRQEGRDEL
jgi:RNA polymerase sigma-70 factor (ECF subfamily)